MKRFAQSKTQATPITTREAQRYLKGVKWFLTDQFGFEQFESWSKPKRWIWIISFTLLAGAIVTAVIYPLAQIWLIGQQSWALFRDVVLLAAFGHIMLFMPRFKNTDIQLVGQ